MKLKRTELVLFLTLILLLILGLLDIKWIKPLLILNFLSLISLWILGYSKRISHNNGFNKSEFWERAFSIPFTLGLIFNITSISYSNFYIIWGLILLLGFYLVKGIRIIIRKDLVTGIELLLIGFILLGYLLRLNHYPGSELRIVFMSLLSVLYFALSIKYVLISKRHKVLSIGIVGMVLYWVLCVYLNAILFDTMFWRANMSLFGTALVFSIIVLPIFILLIYKNRNLPEWITYQNTKLLKRFIIISCISLFFAVATPKQYLKLDHGNRVQLIEADYNCRFNDEIDQITKENSCKEYDQLFQLRRMGYYREGMTNSQLDVMKNELITR